MKVSDDYLIHYGVLGMKWGVRKDKKPQGYGNYKSTSVRAAVARRKNQKVDKSFKKWNENAAKKQSAVDLGKKANESRLAYKQNPRDKSAKSQYKQDNKAYKKALRSNTTYRKGQIKGEVGKDMSRKYMSEAKKALKNGDKKTYSKLMSQHDIERAKARKAPEVGAKRSQKKASAKRAATMTVKGIAGAAAITAGAAVVNVGLSRYGGVRLTPQQIQGAVNVIKKGRKILSYIY